MKEQKEIWKVVDGFINYEVSNCGNVRRKAHIDKFDRQRKEYYLKLINGNGYFRVTLRNNNKSKAFFVHRLVAMMFIPKIKDKNIINHKDGIKTNNNVNNLEWCTYSENSKHAYDILGHTPWNKGKKDVYSKERIRKMQLDTSREVICLDNGKIFDSLSEAGRMHNIHPQAIYQCCILKNLTAGGLKWSYTNDIKYREDQRKYKSGKYLKKKVKCIETDIIYNSLKEAEKDTNICYQSISACCRGKLKHAGYFKWEYHNEQNI